MDLLLSSKRTWLLSYALFWVFMLLVHYSMGNWEIGETIIVLTLVMQILMWLFFVLIIVFRWKTWCRSILTVMYLCEIIYLWCNHVIDRWYIIIPMSAILLVYMLWNIGGVVNCVVASKYKRVLDDFASINKQFYEEYRDKIEKYNTRNNLGFWTRVHTSKEPNWEKMIFDSSGLKMFYIEEAIFGIDITEWEKNITRLDRMYTRLLDKNNTLDKNENLFDEKETIGRIKNKSKSIQLDTVKLEEQERMFDSKIKRNRKNEKKILKRKL